MQIVVGDEALYLVDGDGLVNACAGALGLAAFVADASADGGEGVFLLDELKSVGVSALSGELQVALNGHVRRARCLAGGRAGVDGVLEILAVVGIEGLLYENGVGELCVARRGQILGRAQLLTESERVAGAGLDALCAGDALCLVDFGDEVRADSVSRAEHKACAQTEACACAAVADSGAVADFLNVGDIVHQAVFLGAQDDLHGFLARDLTCAAGADVVLRALAHLNAHVLVQVSAAVADAGARRAAGAGRNGESVVFIQVIRQPFIVAHSGDVLYRALNGDDAHQAVALRQHGAEKLHAYAGVLLEGSADLGMGCHELLVVHHHFEYAGREDLHEVDILAALLVIGAAENAIVDEVIQRGLYLLHGLADLLCEILGCALLAQTGGDGDIGLVVGNDVSHAVVFGGVFVDFDDRAGNTADDLGKLDDLGSELCHFCSLLFLKLCVYYGACFCFLYLSSWESMHSRSCSTAPSPSPWASLSAKRPSSFIAAAVPIERT